MACDESVPVRKHKRLESFFLSLLQVLFCVAKYPNKVRTFQSFEAIENGLFFQTKYYGDYSLWLKVSRTVSQGNCGKYFLPKTDGARSHVFICGVNRLTLHILNNIVRQL